MTRHMSAVELAAVAEILCPAKPGRVWTSVCVWCLERADPHERAVSRRAGGDCMRCSYTGRDTFVACLPDDEKVKL